MKVEVYHRKDSKLYSVLFGYIKIPEILIDTMCREVMNNPLHLVREEHLDKSIKKITGKMTKIVALVPTFPMIRSSKWPGKKAILSILDGVTFERPIAGDMLYPDDFILHERENLCFETRINIEGLKKTEVWNNIGNRVIDQVLLFLFLYYIDKRKPHICRNE